MRLFVGVFPPADAVQHLDAALEAVRDGSGPPRWQPPDRWHVTLAFLGEVPPDNVHRLCAALASVCGASPTLSLRLADAGSFRTGRGAGAWWIGVLGDGLAELAERVRAAALTDCEARTFRGHLTVARWRSPEPPGAPVLAALRSYDGTPWRLEEVVLVRSHLGPQPRYERIEGWPVGSG